MRILKYEKTKNNYYNVFFDNGEVITLSDFVITDNELLIKKEIDDNLYCKLINDNKVYELYEAAIKYISIRLRSVKEVRDYLLKRDNDVYIIDCVCDKLIKNKYLDDDRFAKAYIKDKLNFTMMGDYKIRKELERLGIYDSIIEENISLIDDVFLEERMKKIIEKDMRINKKYSGIILKNKIYNHLLVQGYSQSRVIDVINKYDF